VGEEAMVVRRHAGLAGGVGKTDRLVEACGDEVPGAAQAAE